MAINALHIMYSLCYGFNSHCTSKEASLDSWPSKSAGISELCTMFYLVAEWNLLRGKSTIC